MCSKEEVIKVVADSEQRLLAVMHTELQKLREEVRQDREHSHHALAITINNFGLEVIKATGRLEQFMEKRGEEITDLTTWKAVHSSEATEINKKITDILDNQKWVVRLLIGGLIMAFLGLVVNLK
jgi:hypothetical protein